MISLDSPKIISLLFNEKNKAWVLFLVVMVKKAMTFFSPGRAFNRTPPPWWMVVLGRTVNDPTLGLKATSRQGNRGRRILKLK